MINEDYVSFETAKLLKDVGYPQCKREEQYTGTKYTVNGEFTSAPYAVHYAAPTLYNAMKWLREGYWLNIYALYDSNIWSCIISSMDNRHIIKDNRSLEISGFKSYKDAIDVAIKYCLTNLI